MKRKWHLLSVLILAALPLNLIACKSQDMQSGAHPINRSILLDTGIEIGLEIPGLPPLPKIDIGARFNYRRLSPKEEVDLELAKNGKFRTKTPIVLPLVGPSPVVGTK